MGPLAPARLWPETAQKFSSLFERGGVLHERYAELQPDETVWESLARRGYVHLQPVYQVRKSISHFLPDEPLPEGKEGAEHKSQESVSVTEIAFLTEKDTGLIDAARKSRRKAIENLEFIVEHVVCTDTEAFDTADVSCECGETHRIYKAAWLVPLRNRRWIPLESDGSRATTASAESLGLLLSDHADLIDRLGTGKPALLLDALGIRPSDLLLRGMAEDEDTLVEWVRSMNTLAKLPGFDLSRFNSIVEEIAENPSFMDSLEEQKHRRQLVKKNQEIGALVEEIFRELMEEHSLKVRRTGVGSDYEIESDFVVDNSEVLLDVGADKRSVLVEVKATSADHAKMTPTQVLKACEGEDEFALCVVKVDSDNPTKAEIQHGLRVVFDVKESLRPAWWNYKTVEDATEVATERGGSVELQIVSGQVRFKVMSSVWEQKGLPLREATAEFHRRSLGDSK